MVLISDWSRESASWCRGYKSRAEQMKSFENVKSSQLTRYKELAHLAKCRDVVKSSVVKQKKEWVLQSSKETKKMPKASSSKTESAEAQPKAGTKAKAAAAGKTKEEGKGKKGKVADPDKPKRALSAYFIWLKDNRAKFTVSGEPASETSKRAGAAWKALSESDKKPYEALAAKDKQRYEKEMEEYRKK